MNIEDQIEEMKDELERVQSNLLLLNSSFSGLNSNYKFIQDHLGKIEKKMEARRKEYKVTGAMFINEIVKVHEKIDLMMNKNGKTSGQDCET